jgi:hypothetical protein
MTLIVVTSLVAPRHPTVFHRRRSDRLEVATEIFGHKRLSQANDLAVQLGTQRRCAWVHINMLLPPRASFLLLARGGVLTPQGFIRTTGGGGHCLCSNGAPPLGAKGPCPRFLNIVVNDGMSSGIVTHFPSVGHGFSPYEPHFCLLSPIFAYFHQFSPALPSIFACFLHFFWLRTCPPGS